MVTDTLGGLLKGLRGARRLPDAALDSGISEEHMRNVEADRTRPSAKVLTRMLKVYDAFESDVSSAWVYFCTNKIPKEARRHVRVIGSGVFAEYTQLKRKKNAET